MKKSMLWGVSLSGAIVLLGAGCASVEQGTVKAQKAPQQSYEALRFQEDAQHKRRDKDFQGALADYSKAIELCTAPGADTYRSNIAELYFLRGIIRKNDEVKDYKGALEDFTLAKIYAVRPSYYLQTGMAQLELGQYQQAIDSFDLGLKVQYYNPWCYYGRGLAKAALGDDDGALGDLQTAEEYTLIWQQRFDPSIKLSDKIGKAVANIKGE